MEENNAIRPLAKGGLEIWHFGKIDLAIIIDSSINRSKDEHSNNNKTNE
jgi:hypothetical protein